MKVAIACTFASFVEVNMAEAFEKLGLETWIVKTRKPRFSYRQSRVTFERFEKTIELPSVLDHKLLGQYAPFPIIPNLRSTIRKLRVDIVNVSEYTSPPTWTLCFRKDHWKTVLTQHGYGVQQSVRDKVYNFLMRRVLIRQLDGVVGLGVRAKRFLQELGAASVSVIPNPINTDTFRPEVPYDKRGNLVLYVGKADTRRRLHVLLQAMELVRSKIENVRLLVVGDEGNLSRTLREKDWAQYIGPTQHLALPQYFNMAKVFVHPVLGEAGCGCALEEALACGTPVVGTIDLDFPFTWRDGRVGYVTRPDPQSIAQAVVSVLQNGKRIQGACRDFAVKEFSQRAVGQKYLTLFEEILTR